MTDNPARILVTGSRHYRRVGLVRAALHPYRDHSLELVNGGYGGLDTIAGGVWRGWGETERVVLADWDTYGQAAGGIRNQEMVNLGRYLVCLAFPLAGSVGTWDCVRRARAAGIPVEYL